MSSESALFAALGSGRCRAIDVARTLAIDKKTCNALLYALEKQGKLLRHDGTPPLWEKAAKQDVSPIACSSPAPAPQPSAPKPVPAALPVSHALDESRSAVSHALDEAVDSALWAQQCATAVWRTFDTVNPGTSGKLVVAGFVVREAGAPRVVSLGSGTRSITGDQLSLEGRAVHDSHAEVVARRGLLRWLYNEIEKAHTNPEAPSSFDSKLDLWLYVSLAPCGDSAIFSYADPQPTTASSGAAWSIPKHGMLRTKMESTQGTVPVKAGAVQTLDGLQRGDRLLSHSCSDKIAKWAVAGLQGALLSRLIKPVYLSGVVVSDLFSHGHLCRALCCRSQQALDSAGVIVQAPYHVQHVKVLRALPITRGSTSGGISTSRHEQIQKTSGQSINWADHDGLVKTAESADGGTGLRADGSPTRIAKASLFASFCRVHPQGASYSYVQNKLKASTYQQVKRTWVDAMTASKFGHWACKPCELSEFTCLSSKCLFTLQGDGDSGR